MTEHGRWDVRSWYFTLEFAKKNEAKLVFLSPTEYTETEVRRIVETAWRVGKNEENENE
jgi:hypothetical protein